MKGLRLVWALGLALWFVVLVGGWSALLRHDFTAGTLGRTPSSWPAGSRLQRDRQRPTLLLFAHRNCPCTRSTLTELEQVLSRCLGQVSTRVVLLAPPGMSDRVGRTIEKRARSLPESEVVMDPHGNEARRFGVRTSGHVLLYGVDGRLQFSGGITEARGHEGDSNGGQALLAWLRDGTAERTSAPVYGCALFANEDEESGEDESWSQ